MSPRRPEAAEETLLAQLARPLLFLAWIVGSLFAAPLALRGLGAPGAVAVALAAGCLVGPVAVVAAARGATRGPGRGSQRADIVLAIGWDALAFGGAAYLLLTDRPWAALVLFYTGVLMLGVAVARVRSR